MELEGYQVNCTFKYANMKYLFKTIKISLLIALITVSNFRSLAQEDKISGIYVDGVKVTEIDCYNFGDMTFYIKYSDVLKNFKIISIAYYVETSNMPFANYKKWDYSNPKYYMDKVKFMREQCYANSQMNSGYIKVDIFKKGERFALGMDNTFGKSDYGTSNSRYPRECLMYDINPMQSFGSLQIKRKPADPNKQPDSLANFAVVITGFVETGKINEYYDEYSKTFKREPELESTVLQQVKVKLKNRKIVVAAWDQYPADLFKFEPDYTCAEPKGSKFSDLINSSNSLNHNITENISGNQNTPLSKNTKPHIEKHKNGKLAVQGQFDANGQHEGTWKYYTEAGKIEKIENYKGGIMHGEWKYYDEAGKLVKTEKYNEGELVE